MIGLLHLLLIIVAWTSPWLAPWWVIVIGITLLTIQYRVCDGCVLTNVQFGKVPYNTFYYEYLVRIYPSLSRYSVWLFVRFIAPIGIILLAVVIQEFFGFAPLLARFGA